MERREKNRCKQRHLVAINRTKHVRPVQGELSELKQANRDKLVPLRNRQRSEYAVSQMVKGRNSINTNTAKFE